VLSELGCAAGATALYWRYGLCLYDADSRASAIVEALADADAEDAALAAGYGGEVRIRAKGEGAGQQAESRARRRQHPHPAAHIHPGIPRRGRLWHAALRSSRQASPGRLRRRRGDYGPRPMIAVDTNILARFYVDDPNDPEAARRGSG
jgi:hypothetical protein